MKFEHFMASYHGLSWSRVGYDMIDMVVGYNHLISNKCEWDNCDIRTIV